MCNTTLILVMKSSNIQLGYTWIFLPPGQCPRSDWPPSPAQASVGMHVPLTPLLFLQLVAPLLGPEFGGAGPPLDGGEGAGPADGGGAAGTPGGGEEAGPPADGDEPTAGPSKAKQNFSPIGKSMV